MEKNKPEPDTPWLSAFFREVREDDSTIRPLTTSLGSEILAKIG